MTCCQPGRWARARGPRRGRRAAAGAAGVPRRGLALGAGLLGAAGLAGAPRRAGAEEGGGEGAAPAPAPVEEVGGADGAPGRPTGVFLDLEVDSQPFGRVEVEITRGEAAPAGTQLLLALAAARVGARLSGRPVAYLDPAGAFMRTQPVGRAAFEAFLQADSAREEIPLELAEELARQPTGAHAQAGVLSLVVANDAGETQATTSLQAVDGSLVQVEGRRRGPATPNGSQLVLTALDGQEALDATCLAVGRVRDAQSLDVLRRFLAQVPQAEGKRDSAFLKAGMALGDGRAVATNARIGRPLSRDPASVSLAAPARVASAGTL